MIISFLVGAVAGGAAVKYFGTSLAAKFATIESAAKAHLAVTEAEVKAGISAGSALRAKLEALVAKL